MKKCFQFFGLLILILCLIESNVLGDLSPVRANPLAYWNFKERKVIQTPEKNSPYSTQIQGEEGKKLVTIFFDSRKGKEQAKIEWGWKIPPTTLIPGQTFEMIQSFQIKEWKMDHFVSGTMNSFIQKGDSCVCEGGIDLGTVWMDYDYGNLMGQTKTVKKTALVPNLNEIGSKELKRIQLLVNLKQNNSNYQWIYIYEWKDTANRYKTTIELTVGSQNAVVNGSKKILDSPPFISEGRTFVPFRFLGESFGAGVLFTSSQKTGCVEKVEYRLDQTKVVLTINSRTAWVNNVAIQLDAPPQIRLNRVMVPLRFIAENFSSEVIWNAKSQTIIIHKK